MGREVVKAEVACGWTGTSCLFRHSVNPAVAAHGCGPRFSDEQPWIQHCDTERYTVEMHSLVSICPSIPALLKDQAMKCNG